MALDYDKIKKEFDGLLKRDLKDLTLKDIEAHFGKFEKFYEVCLKLEDALEETIGGARKRGNNATDAKGLSRDPVFKKAYKEYDSSVDDIDKAEKLAFIHTTKTAALAVELKNLKKALDKAKPNSKEKDVVELHKKLDEKIKEMEKASDIYDVRGKHRKMREYSSKFEDKVEKIIDRGPPPEKPEEVEVPKGLQPAELDKAVDTVKKMNDAIVMAEKNIMAIIKTSTPFGPDAERKVKKFETLLDATLQKMRTYIGKITALADKSERDIDKLKREEKREVEEKLEALAGLLKTAEDRDKKADAALKDARDKAKK